LWGDWSLPQLPFGETQGTPWTGHESITGPTQRQTNMHTHINSYSQFGINNKPVMDIFMVGRSRRTQRKLIHAQEEHANSQRGSSWDSAN